MSLALYGSACAVALVDIAAAAAAALLTHGMQVSTGARSRILTDTEIITLT